ncbi:DAN domain family member 5 [Dasypus novemcinctus]|uniref:DAN domain family member 5 n=1 Tax=Dasypus novemcinctus TaxID=9361 RepID=UPI00265D957C|nr:DAN domain family member 5 [Dasypus novemcinctus]
MLLGQIATLLSLLGGAQLLSGWGRPRGPPARPRGAPAHQPRAAGPPGPASALGSWRAFLRLQRAPRWGPDRLPGGQEWGPTVALPLAPQEVARESCKATPFTQVISRPGCTAARLRNQLCFGRCSSLFVPGSDPGPLALCNGCVPARRRWVPVVLRCRVGDPPSRWRRVKTSAALVQGCRCSSKL